MASVVSRLGYGGQSFAENVLGWNRKTIRKALNEQERGVFKDLRKGNSGRKKSTDLLPNLQESIRAIVEPNSQADPTFRSTKIYTTLTAKEVRKRLIKDFGHNNKVLPSRRTISTLMNKLGYVIQSVQKSKPIKKLPETDAIFENLKPLNELADNDPGCLRISIDAKAAVNIGEFSRRGKSRRVQKAYDHDFNPEYKYIPYGLFIPKTNESWVWFAKSALTSDFIADRLEEIWPALKKKFNSPHTLVINIDNGPECSGQRTQWLKRMVELSDKLGIKIRLAYYPPYHSKYNPIERFWGVLENHWNGEILDCIQKAMGLVRSMTYNKIKPVVKKVNKLYKKGVALTKKQMKPIEERLQRKPGLTKWFIDIEPIID